MPSGARPLLTADRSEISRSAEEEDALLTGQPTNKGEGRIQKLLQIGAWSWASISTLVVIILAVAYANAKAEAAKNKDSNCGNDKKVEGKRNLIFMVSDGMGPASVELARNFRQYEEGLPWGDVLTLDKHLIGQSRTRSTNSLVTDSAAGATAFSCGLKSYNNAISVLPDHLPAGTVLEAAKKAGYLTGLVVTTRVTDATPACFASHVQSRFYEDLIAEQMIGHYPLGRVVDLIVGGGRCHFLPNTTAGSCRSDDKNIVAMAKKDGWNYIDNLKDFNNLDPTGGVQLPLLALMADYDIPYEIDRRHVQDQYPSQYEMAVLALEALKAATTGNEKGFFIMIEGSRVDHAGHANDPAAQVHETLMHDKTFAAALDFINKDDTPGILLSTSDHETGGLSAARQLTASYPPYRWFPDILGNATFSASHIASQWDAYNASEVGQKATREEQATFITQIVHDGFGFKPTDKEIYDILVAPEDEWITSHTWVFANMISHRAEIGWSTHGHSAVDVNIYGSDPTVMRDVVGNHENTDIGKFMAKYLDVDVQPVTDELRAKGVRTKPGTAAVVVDKDAFAWMGPIPKEGEVIFDAHRHDLTW